MKITGNGKVLPTCVCSSLLSAGVHGENHTDWQTLEFILAVIRCSRWNSYRLARCCWPMLMFILAVCRCSWWNSYRLASTDVHPWCVQVFMLKFIDIGKVLFISAMLILAVCRCLWWNSYRLASAYVHSWCVQVFMLKFIDIGKVLLISACLLYTSDAADD